MTLQLDLQFETPLVVAYGGGVDSTAMLVGFKQRGVRPNLILMADPGSEKDETYQYFRRSIAGWRKRAFRRYRSCGTYRSNSNMGLTDRWPIIDTAADYGVDVLAAEKCRPRPIWITNPVRDAWGLTIERLQEDVDRLKEAGAAYEVEASTAYDFTPAPPEAAPQQEGQSSDREPELVA
jgi:hypothetical protein